MNKLTAILILLIALLVFDFAVGTGYAASKVAANFEERRTEQLRRLDQRIDHLRDEKACIQGAATQDELKTCREKFKGGSKERRKQS